MPELTKAQMAEQALDDLFADRSVPRSQTIEALGLLRDQINGMFDALADDGED